MKQEIYRHKFTPLPAGEPEVLKGAERIEDAPMFDGMVSARDMARSNHGEVEHRVYNDFLRKWVYLGTFHADGTCTQWTGDRMRLTGDPASPWAKIE